METIGIGIHMETIGIGIGIHIRKINNSYLKSIQTYYKNNSFDTPCQIFTGSPVTWKSPVRNHEDENKTKEYITKNGIQLFIHSKYIINLAKPEKFQTIPLQYDLDVGSAIGAIGVVVHVGKSCQNSPEISIETMKSNMKSLNINENCPLLLETPAGQGTELLTEIETFINFMNEFKTNPKYGICVDTCHVFACGYDPFEYLKKITNDTQQVKLIHLNDSKTEKGSRKDRHETVGNGFIGKECLMKCTQLGIPCVTE